MIKSDNTKGNPYHDKEGKFTSADAGANAPAKSVADTKFGAFINKLKNKKLGATDTKQESAASFIGGINNLIEKYKQLPNDSANQLVKEMVISNEQIKNMHREQQVEFSSRQFLLNAPGLDSDAISKLSNKQIIELANAYDELVEEKPTVNLAVEKYNKTAFEWMYDTRYYPSDYAEMKESGDIDRMLNFYRYDFKGPANIRDERLNDINTFIKNGEKYEQVLHEAEKPFKGANELVNKYKDHNGPYSEERRRKAKIIRRRDVDAEIEATQELLQENTDAWENKLTPSQRDALGLYVAQYDVNDYLRGLNKDSGYDYESLYHHCKAIDSAISGHTMGIDMTLRRGITEIIVNNLGGGGKKISKFSTQEDLNEIIGTSFEDQGFMSCSASRQSNKYKQYSPPVVMNIWCPNGIEMAYLHDWGFYEENEVLINRGYTYTIRNARKVGTHVELDVDCILGSNKYKHNDSKLRELANLD